MRRAVTLSPSDTGNLQMKRNVGAQRTLWFSHCSKVNHRSGQLQCIRASMLPYNFKLISPPSCSYREHWTEGKIQTSLSSFTSLAWRAFHRFWSLGYYLKKNSFFFFPYLLLIKLLFIYLNPVSYKTLFSIFFSISFVFILFCDGRHKGFYEVSIIQVWEDM